MVRQVSPTASSGLGSSRPPSAVRKGSKEKRQGRDNFPASLSSLAAIEPLVNQEDLDRLDSKVTKMEADLGSMHGDIQRVIEMMNDK
ncbi:CACNA1B, partial [Symbiodinium sp. CCMP2456]